MWVYIFSKMEFGVGSVSVLFNLYYKRARSKICSGVGVLKGSKGDNQELFCHGIFWGVGV